MSTRAALLKSQTAVAHAAVEARLTSLRPFATRARYGRFLRAQLQFHCHVEPLYRQDLLPGGGHASRLALIEADLRDLGLEPVGGDAGADMSAPAAAGWLYVAEGSKLGAAILFRAVAGLGLDAGFGARHLAGQGEARARDWRRFTETLNALTLTPVQDEAMAAAANAAFGFFAAGMERAFAGAEA